MSDNTEKSQKQLTVGELIELLKTFPSDDLVWHEGCDCWGEANGAALIRGRSVSGILITRSGGDYK